MTKLNGKKVKNLDSGRPEIKAELAETRDKNKSLGIAVALLLGALLASAAVKQPQDLADFITNDNPIVHMIKYKIGPEAYLLRGIRARPEFWIRYPGWQMEGQSIEDYDILDFKNGRKLEEFKARLAASGINPDGEIFRTVDGSDRHSQSSIYVAPTDNAKKRDRVFNKILAYYNALYGIEQDSSR